MAYKIRIILNTEEDVIRDIAISKLNSLEDLHNIIINAFGFDGSEMASFYRSDEDWNQGEEFPLFDMSEGSNGIIQMQDISIEEVLVNAEDKMIYVYDFFTMWSFYVELIEKDFEHNLTELPDLLFSLGSIPNNAPEINFESENLSEDDYIEEEDEDEFNYGNFDEMMN